MPAQAGRRQPPAEREPLSRETVLQAALAVIDRDGLDGLTMRKLGAELGVEAMSLYNHVRSKADVLDGVVRLLWAEVESRAGDAGDWRQQARALATAVRRTAHAHPSAYPLVLTRGVLPTELIRIGGKLLTALREAGFGELAQQAMLVLSSHATSQALAEVTWYGERAAEALRGDVAEWPPVVGVERELPQHDADSPFGFGLELLIEALEARLAREGWAAG